MVVDYKLFVPNSPQLGAGLLFVLEQIPFVTFFFICNIYYKFGLRTSELFSMTTSVLVVCRSPGAAHGICICILASKIVCYIPVHYFMSLYCIYLCIVNKDYYYN